MIPSGVAPVTPSTSALMNGQARLLQRQPGSPPGATQVVRAVGKAACRNARPTSAGLKRLWPSPPQTSLPRPTPTAPPRKAIHIGSPGGRIRPRMTPVKSALISSTGLEPPGPLRPHSHSMPTAPAVAAATTRSALAPKNQMAINTTGSSASRTSRIKSGVVVPCRM